MAAKSGPVLRDAGDSGLIVEFAATASEEANNAALCFDARLREAPIAGVSETAPTIRSVLLRYDPLTLPPATLRARVSEILAERDWLAAPPPERVTRWRVPACYGGEHGPELPETADLVGLTERAAIEEHAGAEQRVLMLGFQPGFAYLGFLPERWNIPRLDAVKPAEPSGVLLIAVRQTTFAATTVPTGWRAIGRSPFLSFDLRRERPFLLEPGDRVSFEPVSAAEFERLSARAAEGEIVASREQAS